MQIIYEILVSLTSLYGHFVAPDAFFSTLVLKERVFLVATNFIFRLGIISLAYYISFDPVSYLLILRIMQPGKRNTSRMFYC